MKAKHLLGDEKVGPETLETIRKKGGKWFAYQNHDLGDRNIGNLQFLKAGPECTFPWPPPRMPDTERTIGWRYILVGKLDLATGEIIDTEESDFPPHPRADKIPPIRRGD